MSLQQEIYESTVRIATDTSLTHEQAMMNLSKIPGQFVYGFTPPEVRPVAASGVLSTLAKDMRRSARAICCRITNSFWRKGAGFCASTRQDLFEAIEALKMFYRHVPSITNFPVYLGRLDRLRSRLFGMRAGPLSDPHFFTFLDRTISDSYAHANIGPETTLAGEIRWTATMNCRMRRRASRCCTIRRLRRMRSPALRAKRSCLRKPSFANDRVYRQAYRVPYGVASCYNVLPVGGGAFTLAR
jgi:hypothetical protein